MRIDKLIISEEVLEKVLTLYQGKLIDKSSFTSWHEVGMNIYTDPKYLFDPRIEYTVQLNVTDVYKNYVQNYKNTPAATFTTFVKWLLIKSMANTPFNWREINGHWYEFANLPLEVVVRTKERRELVQYTLENVSRNSWEDFCKKHQDFKSGKYENVLAIDVGLPIHWIAYQLTGVHLPRMTSYKISTRAIYAHQPWFVFSDRYEQGSDLYLPLHLSHSHATLTPEDAELLFKQFIAYGIMTPADVLIAQPLKGAGPDKISF